MYDVISLSMAEQKNSFLDWIRKRGLHPWKIPWEWTEDEGGRNEIFEITINDGTVSNALKERAKQLAAIDKELLDQAYVQVVTGE